MPGDGIFVDCRSHWKGRIGQLTASFAKYEGGVLHIGDDGPDRRLGLKNVVLRLACRLRLVCRAEKDALDCDKPTLIRQENDPAPKFHFLEEGPVRLGMRIAFDLIDDEGHYHGDGRQDIWLYPEGDVHCTFNMQVVDRAAHGAIQDAFVEILGDARYERLHLSTETLQVGDTNNRPFGSTWPERAAILENEREAVALYWARDAGHVWEVGSDHGSLPPFYASRWPTGMQQWSRGGMGWTCHGASAGVEAAHNKEGSTLRFYWLRDAHVEERSEREATFTATLVVSRSPNQQDLERRIKAVQQPLIPAVNGGLFRCYSEEDGAYEVGQIDPSAVEITFPPDPLERDIRLRFFRRKTDPRHRGGIAAWVNGESARLQLVSEGQLTDDICVPMEMSPRNDSVDDVLLSAQLSSKNPTVIRIEKTAGIQAVYQSEISGVDLNRRAGNHRDFAIWSSHNAQAPLLEFDLFSGAVHRLTHYKSSDPVVWEMPLAFFKSCGISKHHYCNQVREFKIEENGPDAVSLYFRATNPNGRAQSETWLRTPYQYPRPRLEVRMRFTALEQWDDDNIEFSDIFPYPSRLPETWCHDAVLFVQRDRTHIKYNYRPDLSGGSNTESDDPRLFYALFPAARGNILTLIDNPQHPQHKLHHSVCGNYIDIHVNFHAPKVPVPPGTAFDINYICEIYGDEHTSVDELKAIGLHALESGNITID